MPTLPRLDISRNSNESPHVIILGAGASLAACPGGDALGQQLPLMHNLVDIVGLQPLIFANGLDADIDDFEAFYSRVIEAGGPPNLVEEINDRIREYFAALLLPDEPTIYDYLVLSLRKKDIIATFNWDPLLAQAYRRNMHVGGMPEMAFLHGNVAIGICRDHTQMGFLDQRCPQCGQALQPTPLLYPICKKDYASDSFIASQWQWLCEHLQNAYFVTIFGYSAPVTDEEARALMLKVWHENQTKEFTRFTVVDIKNADDLHRTWQDFKLLNNFGTATSILDTYMMRHPRRSCDAFAMASLQQTPWHDNPWPHCSTLAQMQRWIQPLAAEEAGPRLSGKPLDGL